MDTRECNSDIMIKQNKQLICLCFYFILFSILTWAEVKADNGTISGVVYEDVSPYASIPNLSIICYDFYLGDYVAMDSTLSDGSYHITLTSGEYKVYAQPENESMYIPEYFKDTFDSYYAKKVNVTSGQSVTNINFALSIGGIIEGHVLRDSDETPISFMRIEAYDYEKGNLQGYTTSLDNGQYFLHVPEGRYKLRAYDTRGRNYVTVFYDEVYYNNEIYVISDNFDGINAHMVDVENMTITGYYNFFINEGIKVEGIVTGINQAPLPNIVVWALATNGKHRLWEKTLSDGTYEIIVPEASYWFYADSSNYMSQYYQNVTDIANAAIITVDQHIDGIDFNLKLENDIKYSLVDVISMLQLLSNISINHFLSINDYDQNNNKQLDIVDILQIMDTLIK